jgi:nitrogen-specific signal transduction histidine kinase
MLQIRKTFHSDIPLVFAHEINQTLSAILNNDTAAQILSSRNEEKDDEIDDILGDIIQDANRIDQIVQRIRAAEKKKNQRISILI